MTRRASGKAEHLRIQIAQEAARLMADSGIRDFAHAKRKAAARYGETATRNLPTNQEIEAALFEHLRLFRGESQPQRLRELREVAVRAMRLLARFEPRLVGQVLKGTADRHSAVHLHLFVHTPEEVGVFLMERGIDYRLDERTLRATPQRAERYPLYAFQAGSESIELTIFPVDGLRHPPLSPVDGRPMRRADLPTAEALLTT